jgi:hypothetical protein
MTLVNVLHGNLTAAGPLNPGIAESIFSAIKAATSTTTWLTHLHTGISLTGVHVKDLRAAFNPTIESTGVSIPGTSTGGELPQDCASVATLRTAQSGRGFVGRAYLPGLTQDNLADSRHWNSSLGPAMIAFMNGINTAMTAQGLPWVLAQRALLANTDPNAPPPYNQPRQAAVIPITACAMADTRVDSQRKRLGR